MKLLSLNIWAGHEFEPLTEYISAISKGIDIYCFQEVMDTPTSNTHINGKYRADIFRELKRVLPDHQEYFAPSVHSVAFRSPAPFELSWGLAMFIKKGLKIREIGDFFIYGERDSIGVTHGNVPRNLQYAVIDNGNTYSIAHFHGLWTGIDKNDTEERIEQSKRVKTYTNGKNKLVLCGDLNLSPETQSLALLEEELVNLIKTHNISTTRSTLYLKPSKFADYTLVSRDIVVNQFEVPNVLVSDHLPMILDFS